MDVADEIEKVARLSHGRLVAILAARTGNVTTALDALSDAVLRALEVWPRTGVPDRPEAWLVSTARNLHIDQRRKAARAAALAETLALLDEERTDMPKAATPDQILNLMFVCAHPAIEPQVRTPLMLQLVLGLDARRMAGAFLVPPGTLGQRLTRARAKIEAARIGFSLPDGDDLAPRARHVLDAVYAAFTVGMDGEGAGDGKSSSLAREAVWLASLVAAEMPTEPEAQALFALLLFTHARRPARVDADGCLVPLDEQDTALWNAAMLADAELALRLAARRPTLGRYQLEAAIAAAHADRRHGRVTDWQAIAGLYRGLAAIHPTVGAEVGLAAALTETGDVAGALAALDAIDPRRASAYQPWWAVRAHVLQRLGRSADAVDAYGQAIALTADPALKMFLARRRDGIMR